MGSVTKVSRRYHNILSNYLRWKPKGVFLRPTFVYATQGVPAAVAMCAWESSGTPLPFGCLEPDLLADYVQGKQNRDWHISEWRQGVKDGYFLWWEFIGTFELTRAECQKIFHIKELQ